MDYAVYKEHEHTVEYWTMCCIWGTCSYNTIALSQKLFIWYSNSEGHTVFLTHISIRQMPTWLPTWKAKLLYHVGIFLPTWFFLPLKKFKTIKIKPEKDPYTQTNTFLLHMSRNFKEILKYICFTLYLQQTVSNWKSAIVFMDRRCLPCFFQ